MKKLWKFGILGLLVAGFAVAYLVMPKGKVGPVLPAPNGYDDFVRAAPQAVSHRHLTFGEASDEELKELVDENREALALARAGSERECRVAMDYNLGLAEYSSQHMPVLAQFKKLALAFRAEGELAEREGRTNDAARIYVDGIRFGQQVCRGGLLIDRLVGVACEGINLEPLTNLARDLDSRTCRELASLLERMDATREPVEATWKEERFWASHSGSALEQIRNRIMLLMSWGSLQASRQKAEAKFARIQLQERDLMLQLAARAYQLDHGKAPERPDDLVPEYLRSTPADPVTGLEMTLP